MATPSPQPAYPLLFSPRSNGTEEQRAYFHRRFAEFSEQLASCRQDDSHRFVVDDLHVFRAFFDSHCDGRAYIRELVAARRITTVHYRAPETDDPLQLELWRRNAMYGVHCWEGILGGTGVSPVSDWSASLTPALARLAELLLEAEKLTTFAHFADGHAPDGPLDRAWRQALFVHACGAAEDAWPVDVQACWQEAWRLATQVRDEAAHHLAAHVNTASAKGAAGDGASLVVINTSGQTFAGLCVARVLRTGALASGFDLVGPNGLRVPFQTVGEQTETGATAIQFEARQIPALGLHTYSLRPAASLSAPPVAVPAPSSLLAVQTGIHLGPLPPDFAFLARETPEVQLLALRPLDSPCAESRAEAASTLDYGLLLRLCETTGTPQTVSLAFGPALLGAWRVDDLGRKTEDVPRTPGGWRQPPRVVLKIGAHETVSLVVRLEPAGEAHPTGPAEELRTGPVFGRYWQHNSGAAPEGNLPLGLWTEGHLTRGQNTRFPICLSNDSPDHEYVGSVELRAPKEWTLIPRRVPYRIPPRSQGLFEAMIVVPEDAPPCFLRAETWDGSRVIQDVLPIGEVQPLVTSLTRATDSFALQVTNPNADLVEGEIALVLGTGSTPPPQQLRLEAGETRELTFRDCGEIEGGQAVAKITWYGNVQYVRADG